MAVESMRTEGEAVYEVVGPREGDPPGENRLWARVFTIVGKPGASRAYAVPGAPVVAGMHAEGHEIGTRLRVKTTTVAKIERPKKVAK